MNKKIYKGYELAQAVDNGILNLEQKVKSADDITYFDCTIGFVLKDVAKNIMFKPFEILEDNTEEIEELKYDVVDENGRGWYKLDTIADKVTELIKAVNQIRKEKNNV